MISAQKDPEVVGAMMAWNLPENAAKTLLFLNRKWPRLVSADQIVRAVHGELQTGKRHCAYDYLRQMRNAGIPVVTELGEGYSIKQQLNIPRATVSAAREGVPWEQDEIAELLRMRGNGSAWWAIADELERTERSCKSKYGFETRKAGGGK